jgi:hypothetical protein
MILSDGRIGRSSGLDKLLRNCRERSIAMSFFCLMPLNRGPQRALINRGTRATRSCL